MSNHGEKYRTCLSGVRVASALSHALDHAHMLIMAHVLLEKGTSRQRSGKGAIRKRFPLQKPRREKTKPTIRYLYHENIS